MADTENETKNEKKTFLQNVYNKGCDIIETTVEIGASYHLGQNLIKQLDRFLWTLEKSAIWSVSSPSNTSKQPESNGTFGKPAPLVRPLPWILFLPLLVIMRMIRASLNMGAVFVGADSVKPTTVVKFIQVRRRRLRVIKYRGLRKMAIKKTSTEVSNDEAVTWGQKIYNSLHGAMCVYPKHNETTEKIVHAINSNEVPVPVKTENKRKHDDLDSDNEVEDPEYVPSCSESDDSTDDSDDERDEDEPVCDAKPLLKRPSSKTSLSADVIKEENENEDTDSSTTSAESNDTQKRKEPAFKIKETVPESSKTNGNGTHEHFENKKNSLDGVTSDEFFSPEDSECPSPEPKIPIKMNLTKNDLSEPHFDEKIVSQKLISTEQVQNNMNGSNIAMANKGRTDGNGHAGNNRSHGKRKNKKKISNPFNRRRK